VRGITIFLRGCFLAVLLVSMPPWGAAQGRKITPDDYLNQVRVDLSGWSPDGYSIAYAKSDPRKNRIGEEDIWIADARSNQAQMVSPAELDRSSWGPKWSPDGRRLAFFSRKWSVDAGVHASLWVWDKADRKVHQLTQEDVNDSEPYFWISDHEVLCSLYAPGEAGDPHGMDEMEAGALEAIRAWKKAWANNEPSVSVIESGIPQQSVEASLVVIDVLSGHRRIVWNGATESLSVSPDHKLIAFLASVGPITLDPNIGRRETLRMVVSDLSGTEICQSRETFARALDALPEWSMSSGKFAFSGRVNGSITVAPAQQLFVADVEKKTFESVPSVSGRRVLAQAWTLKKLIVLVAPPNTHHSTDKRNTWLVVNADGTTTALSGDKPESAPKLVARVSSDNLLGFADGQLWIIEPGRSAIEKVAIEKLSRIERVLPAACKSPLCDVDSGLLVKGFAEKQTDSSGRWFRVNMALHPATTTELNSNEFMPGKEISSYSSIGAAVLTEESVMGSSSAWVVAPGQEQLVPLYLQQNAFLADIKLGKVQGIKYRDLEGEERGAELTLPPDYQPGHRYPLVVLVYPGTVFAPIEEEHEGNLGDTTSFPQLLAARGYAVLEPSMPLPFLAGHTADSETNGNDPYSGHEPYSSLLTGVMPAVDRTIDIGIADGKRLAVMGHSFGGFATNALITLTDRFKAAISLAGLSDFASYYGGFSPYSRYNAKIEEWNTLRVFQSEYGQNYEGGPPWEVPERYIRNSPLFFADRIHTPLMLIHGDLDFVSIQQAEEMYSALRRQNKRCRFVRYWTQCHLFTNPSAFRDEWKEIYKWLDEFVGESAEQGKAGTTTGGAY
jgi:dipeptidyl aminopeptidase/acylaminoacyl peptidase